MRDDVMEQILNELDIPGDEPKAPSRIVTPKAPRLVRPSRPIVGTGLGTGRMNPKMEMSRRLIVDDSGVGLGQIENLRAEGPFEDEIDAYLLDKAQAAIGPRGVRLDNFYTFSQMRVAQQQAQAPLQGANPVSATGAQVGQQATVWAGTGAGAGNNPDLLEVARWNGKDSEATQVTCTVFPINLSTGLALGTALLRPFARIRFGTSGYAAQADIDVGMGVQFSIGCSFMSVSVGLDTVSGTLTSMDLVGMISFRPCMRTAPLTRTLLSGLIAATDVATIRVPPAAKAVTVYRTAVAGGTADVAFSMSTQTTDSVGDVGLANIAAGAHMTTPAKLPNGTLDIVLQNNGGTSTRFKAVFELGL